MYLTKEEFNAIEKALGMLPNGEEYKQLDKENQDIIVEADVSMLNVLKREREKSNKFPCLLINKIKSLRN